MRTPHRVTQTVAAVVAAGLASSTLALAAPAAQAVVPPSASAAVATPTGKALVRVDGGTAYAKKIARNKYRFAVPAGASIQWYGEAGGEGLLIGSFTPSALVQGWQRLGHRAGVGALATIAWGSKGDTLPTAIQARVWNPRVSKDGLLVFTARAERSEQAIPQTLPGFSINILRAQTTPRGYPIYFGTTALSSKVYVGISAGGDFSASVAIGTAPGAWVTTNDPVNWTNCPSTGTGGQPTNPLSMSGQKRIEYDWGPFTCGDVSIGANHDSDIHTQYAYLPADPDRVNSFSEIQFYCSLMDKRGKYIPFDVVLGSWVQGGKSPSPLPPAPPS